MPLELTRPLVVLDVETTGTHPQVDRVVQVGLVKVYPDGRETEWMSRINPGMAIPPETSAIHGITDEMVASAPRFKDVASPLAGGLRGCDLAGFQIYFDKLFLEKEFERCGGRGIFDGARIVDALRIYKQRHPRTLAAAVEEYLGEKLDGAHDALVDARATWRVLKSQVERYPDLPRDVEELHHVYFESPADGHLDQDGKLAWRYGEATINFGKWATVPLEKVERSYLQWMINGDFSESVKRIIRAALQGSYPKRG